MVLYHFHHDEVIREVLQAREHLQGKVDQQALQLAPQGLLGLHFRMLDVSDGRVG